MGLILIFVIFSFGGSGWVSRFSLCSSGGLELTEIFMTSLLKARVKGICHHAWPDISVSNFEVLSIKKKHGKSGEMFQLVKHLPHNMKT